MGCTSSAEQKQDNNIALNTANEHYIAPVVNAYPHGKFKSKCVFCDVPTNSQASWDEHMSSAAHQELVETYAAKDSCDVCGCKVAHLVNWEEHLGGRRHRMLAKEQKETETPAASPNSWCVLCDSEMGDWMAHMASEAHIGNAKMYSDKSHCEYCGCTVMGLEDWDTHLHGRKHRSAVKSGKLHQPPPTAQPDEAPTPAAL